MWWNIERCSLYKRTLDKCVYECVYMYGRSVSDDKIDVNSCECLPWEYQHAKISSVVLKVAAEQGKEVVVEVEELLVAAAV